MPKKTNLKVVPPQQKEAWEEELAAKAKAARAQETLGVMRLTHKSAVLQIDQKRVENNRLALIVLGVVYSKEWQEHGYTKDSKDTPACYAFNADQNTGDRGLHPHPAAPKKQHEDCDTCQHNKFGTAEKGRGKRCQDRRRLLFIAASDLAKQGDKNLEQVIAKATHYQTSVPPGSLKNYAAYLKEVGAREGINGSIQEVITELSAEGNPETGAYTLTFSCLGDVPREAMKFLMKRSAEAPELLMQPFPVIEQEAVKPQDNRPVKGQGKRK